MNSRAQAATASAGDVPACRGNKIRRLADALVLAAFLAMMVRAWLPESAVGWPEAFFLVALTGFILASASRELPLQNVLLAAVIVGVAGGVASLVGALTPVPFGPARYADAMGPRLVKVLPWALPLVWIMVIFTARGVGRLILRPWRGTGAYGYRLLGLTALLSLVLDYGLEQFAAGGGYWFWERNGGASDSRGNAPITHYLCWFLASVLIAILAIPAWIRKQPGEPPPASHPLIVWVGLNLLFAAGAVGDERWLTAGVMILISVAPWLALPGRQPRAEG